MVTCDSLLLKLVLLLACVCWLISSGDCSEYVTIDKPPDKFASRVCGSVNTNSTVEMPCPNNTWFHVTGKISSSDNFSNCSSSGFPTTNFLLSASSSAPPLVPVCRGRQSFERDTQLCNETIQVSSKINKSAGVEFFEVTYKCIRDDLVYNMCDDLSKEISTDGLYLASPSFFSLDKTRLPPDTTCTCTLTTTGSFAAQALYLSLHEEDWNMTCDSCGISFVYVDNPTVNENLFQDRTENKSYSLRIDLRPLHRNQKGKATVNELWISFKGGSRVGLQCNGLTTTAITPTPSACPTTNTTTTTSTSATHTTTENDVDGTILSETTFSSSFSSMENNSGTVVAQTTTSPGDNNGTVVAGTTTTPDRISYIIAGAVSIVLIIVVVAVLIIIRKRKYRKDYKANVTENQVPGSGHQRIRGNHLEINLTDSHNNDASMARDTGGDSSL